MISLDALVPGEPYDRPYLAELWGYADWHALGRGVFTPAREKFVVLFVTKEKQETLVQYKDHFEGDTLFMEGERGATAANRRLNEAATVGDRIILFYRERHHQRFTYYGEVLLERTDEDPARIVFVFTTERSDVVASNALATEVEAHGQTSDDLDSEGEKRVRQHVEYERSRKSRADAVRLHGTVCKGCGFDFDVFYGGEFARAYIEIHHLVSITAGQRPVDPRTDLVPLCANCHAMVHRRRGEILGIEELKRLIHRAAAERAR